MKNLTFILPLFITGFVSCGQPQNGKTHKKIEVIESVTKQFPHSGNEFSKPFMEYKDRAWYRDSMAIETVSSLNIATDSKNNTTKTDSIMHYRFSDLRNRVIYEYQNFSDTARLIRKYSFDDTSIFITSGWNFKFKRNWTYTGQPDILPDTSIDNINYKRVRLNRNIEGLPYIMTCYFRCDKKGTVFSLDPSISEITGCPLVKLYNYSPIKKGLHILCEVKFLADQFTEQEQKVFDVWELYAKEHPVND